MFGEQIEDYVQDFGLGWARDFQGNPIDEGEYEKINVQRKPMHIEPVKQEMDQAEVDRVPLGSWNDYNEKYQVMVAKNGFTFINHKSEFAFYQVQDASVEKGYFNSVHDANDAQKGFTNEFKPWDVNDKGQIILHWTEHGKPIVLYFDPYSKTFFKDAEKTQMAKFNWKNFINQVRG